MKHKDGLDIAALLLLLLVAIAAMVVPVALTQPALLAVPAVLVLIALCVVLYQRRNRCHLQRRKGAVIVIAFNTCQRADQRFVANHKADTPARHVVAFRQRKELDRHIACTRHLHD